MYDEAMPCCAADATAQARETPVPGRTMREGADGDMERELNAAPPGVAPELEICIRLRQTASECLAQTELKLLSCTQLCFKFAHQNPQGTCSIIG